MRRRENPSNTTVKAITVPVPWLLKMPYPLARLEDKFISLSG